MCGDFIQIKNNKNDSTMILKYNTGKLPPNFIYFGYMLFGLGIWRMVVLDWMGIMFFIISLIFLLLRSGIFIDTSNRKLKNYTGILGIQKGKWESIESVVNLQILKTQETQGMHVLSISRSETVDVYILYMVLSKGKIELMSGEKEIILSRAEEIGSALQVPVK